MCSLPIGLRLEWSRPTDAAGGGADEAGCRHPGARRQLSHDRMVPNAAEPHAHGARVLLPARGSPSATCRRSKPWIGCSIGIPAIDVIAIESPVAPVRQGAHSGRHA